MNSTTPIALTIAGSDCSAGAGIQADLKTFAAHGVYGVTAVTAVLAEAPGSIEGVEPVTSISLHSQLEQISHAFPLSAVKTGMLAEEALVEAVVHWFSPRRKIPLVIDPVICATAGRELLTSEGVERLKSRLFPLARLATPNLPEAEALLGEELDTADSIAEAPRKLHDLYGCSFLVKGGHSPKSHEVTDYAWIDGRSWRFAHPRVPVPDIHGTGCTLSAAIAARLAQGRELPEAIELGIRYLTLTLEQHHRWKAGSAHIEALNHFPDDVDFPLR